MLGAVRRSRIEGRGSRLEGRRISEVAPTYKIDPGEPFGDLEYEPDCVPQRTRAVHPESIGSKIAEVQSTADT